MSTKTLAEEMQAIRDGSSDRGRRLYDALVKHLRDSGALSGALKAGGEFPDFQLASAEGRFVTRAEILAKGPAIFVFDRGGWCTYCKAALTALAKATPQIHAAGASLVVITPEAGGAALRTKVAHGFDFEMLCDLDGALAMECGLVFPVSDELRKAYLDGGIDLERIYGNNGWMLPAPASFVVGRDAVVVRAAVAVDFRYREEPTEILKHLAGLR